MNGIPSLNTIYFGNPVSSWLTAVAITLGVGMLVRFVAAFVTARTAKRTTMGSLSWLEASRRVAGSVGLPFGLAIGLAISLPFLELSARVLSVVRALLTLVLLIQIGLSLSRVLSFFVDRAIAERPDDGARAMTVRAGSVLARILLFVLLAIVALDNFGVNVTALVAGLGVGGIALALAVQRILGDVLASLTIVLDRPFVLGDFITVGNVSGTIEQIGLKTTRIRSLSGEQLVFPNSELLQSTIANYKRMLERRVAFRFNVDYGTAPEILRAIPTAVKTIIDAQKIARFDRCHLLDFTDTALSFEVVYFVRSPDFAVHADARQEINVRLLEEMNKMSVKFSLPRKVVYLASVPDARNSVAPD